MRLLNELNVTVRGNNVNIQSISVANSAKIVQYVNEFAKMLPTSNHFQNLHPSEKDFNNFKATRFGRKFEQVVEAIHEFYSKLVVGVEPGTSQLDCDQITVTVVFTLEVMKALIDYLRQLQDKLINFKCFGRKERSDESKAKKVCHLP